MKPSFRILVDLTETALYSDDSLEAAVSMTALLAMGWFILSLSVVVLTLTSGTGIPIYATLAVGLLATCIWVVAIIYKANI